MAYRAPGKVMQKSKADASFDLRNVTACVAVWKLTNSVAPTRSFSGGTRHARFPTARTMRYGVVVGKRCRVADLWRFAQVSPSGPRVLHSAH